MANLKGRDYIETQDLSDDELNLLLDTSAELKAKYHRGEPTQTINPDKDQGKISDLGK